MHIWNYFWAFKSFLDLAKGNKAYIFIADYHSLTSVHSKDTLEHNKLRLLKEYFALLPVDTEVIVYEQSKVKRINDFIFSISVSLILASVILIVLFANALSNM